MSAKNRAPTESWKQNITPEHADAWIEASLERGMPVPLEVEQEYYQRQAAKQGIEAGLGTFRDFVHRMNPTLLGYEHVPTLIDVGQRIVDGLLHSVIVMLPPRYLKSEIMSKLLAAYYLLKHKRRHVAVTSYVARLAWVISDASRNFFQRAGGQLSQETKAKDRWVTADGGELWAIGMEGGILGHGYHLGLVDDPMRPQDVRSPTFQERFESWWPDTWLSRQERAMAQIVVTMQRLGPEDPIDFLFRREVGERTPRAPRNWHVVCLDEIHSDEPLGRWDGPQGLPPTCTLEPDLRKPGQVLSPSWVSLELAKAAQANAGPLTGPAQRQQRPAKPEGAFWVKKWFDSYETLPPDAHNGGRDWDTAYGEEGAASANILSYRGAAQYNAAGKLDQDRFFIYIEDVDWNDYQFPELVAWMRRLSGPHYVENKATGKSAVQTLKTYGVQVQEVGVKGDKLARASAAQPAVSNGRILVNAKVTEKLLLGAGQGLLRVTAEMLQSGRGGLDVNDVFVQAIHRHLNLSGELRRGWIGK